MNNLRYIIEGNWEQIKGNIQNHWGKLTDSDIEKINGSYKEFKGKLQKIYGYKASEIENEIIDFLESPDFDEIKRQTENKIEQIKSIVSSTLGDSLQTIKKKSLETERAVVEYASENPLKIIVAAAAVGLLAGCILKAKKS